MDEHIDYSETDSVNAVTGITTSETNSVNGHNGEDNTKIDFDDYDEGNDRFLRLDDSKALPSVWTAVVTPFDKSDNIDIDQLCVLMNHIMKGGSGVVLFGTTGEASTITNEEKIKVLEHIFTTEINIHDVMVGVGGNNTKESIYLANEATRIGYGTIMITTPYYNVVDKKTDDEQEELFAHFTTIAKRMCDFTNVFLYNVPSRTGINLLPSTVKRISDECNNVYGIKEASGNLQQMIDIVKNVPKIKLFCGDDSLIVPSLAIGARGIISVVSNIFPSLVVDVCYDVVVKGDFGTAMEKYMKYHNFTKMMFTKTNPGPIKFALWRAGLLKNTNVRLPLVPLKSKELKDSISIYIAEHNGGLAHSS